MLKNIGKELLFSGCNRELVNDDGYTAKDIFEQNLNLFEADEIRKIRYILSKPKPCSCLRLTRPIEKVTKSKKTQIISVIVDIIVLSAFGILAFLS